MRLTRATRAQIERILAHDRDLYDGTPCLNVPERSAWWVVDGDPSNGYCGARVTLDGRTCVMERAWLAPHYRGCGLQRRMLRVRLAFGRKRRCRKAYTYTWFENVPCQRNLARAGFLPVRIRESEDGKWIVYERPLSPA